LSFLFRCWARYIISLCFVCFTIRMVNSTCRQGKTLSVALLETAIATSSQSSMDS
jgi:hypothetical protein